MNYTGVGVNSVALTIQLIVLICIIIAPIVLGFTVVRRDANRVGQPGWLWAILTIPFGWLALLVYGVVRATTRPRG